MAYYFNRYISLPKFSFYEMVMIPLTGGINERCPTALYSFLPKNILSHNLWSFVAVGETVPHKESLKSLGRKGISRIRLI
jgi:hypothetical protein